MIDDLDKRMSKFVNGYIDHADAFSVGIVLQCYNPDCLFIHDGMIPLDNKNFIHNESSYVTLLPNTKYGCNVSQGRLQIMLPGVEKKWSSFASFVGKELDLLKVVCKDINKCKLLYCEVINEIINKGGFFKVEGVAGASNRK
jgi:hypothetical protein